jgi:exopolyphosphatase/guanosine-5'-triphosphate,3'-diphosphate pyrophosphatase
VDGAVLTREVAADAVRQLCAMGRDGLARHPCVGPERADFVLPGCAIFEAIHRLWPADDVVVADRGLREGMLLRLIRAERARATRRPRAFRAEPLVPVGLVALADTPIPA